MHHYFCPAAEAWQPSWWEVLSLLFKPPSQPMPMLVATRQHVTSSLLSIAPGQHAAGRDLELTLPHRVTAIWRTGLTMRSTATARWLRAMLADYRDRSLVRHHGPFCPSPPASARSGAVSRARVSSRSASRMSPSRRVASVPSRSQMRVGMLIPNCCSSSRSQAGSESGVPDRPGQSPVVVLASSGIPRARSRAATSGLGGSGCRGDRAIPPVEVPASGRAATLAGQAGAGRGRAACRCPRWPTPAGCPTAPPGTRNDMTACG